MPPGVSWSKTAPKPLPLLSLPPRAASTYRWRWRSGPLVINPRAGRDTSSVLIFVKASKAAAGSSPPFQVLPAFCRARRGPAFAE